MDEKLDRLVCSSWLDRNDVFQLNVMNRGAIPNVDANAVVELPVLADRFGYHAIQFGPLPTGWRPSATLPPPCRI